MLWRVAFCSLVFVGFSTISKSMVILENHSDTLAFFYYAPRKVLEEHHTMWAECKSSWWRHEGDLKKWWKASFLEASETDELPHLIKDFFYEEWICIQRNSSFVSTCLVSLCAFNTNGFIHEISFNLNDEAYRQNGLRIIFDGNSIALRPETYVSCIKKATQKNFLLGLVSSSNS